MRLSAAVPVVSATLEQWLVEPSLGYKFCDCFAGFAGVRYNNLTAN